MGATTSKPTSTAAAPVSEKQASSSSSSSHHAADRLARIQAEAEHRASRWHEATQSQEGSSKASPHVTADNLEAWSAKAFENPTCKLASRVLHNANISDSLHIRASEVANQHVYNVTIPDQAKSVTNQKSSGRCWLFALTNLIRLEVIKQLDIKDGDFELSQSYLHFYDKLEKANYWLENVIDLADRPWDDRELAALSADLMNDGGQFDMATNLVVKYGCVPQSVYPESFNSSDTSKINWLAKAKLREMAQELRDTKRIVEERLNDSLRAGRISRAQRDAAVLETVRAKKERQMKDVYRILAIAYGEPPKPNDEFTFGYMDSKNKYRSVTTTPYDFQVKYTGAFTAKGSASIVNDPRNELGKLMTVERLGNIWNGQPVKYINKDPDFMIEKVVETLKAGYPVWFGVDVGAYSHTPSGIMDVNLFDYENAFDIKLGLTKKERLEMGESQMTHAMLISAVHLDEKTGKPVRFRVENSWGPTAGKDGFMVMTTAWFKEFCYQVVIRKEFLPKEMWQLFENGVDENTIRLPCYDPMGALA